MWVNWFTTEELNGYHVSSSAGCLVRHRLAVGYRWILYEYNRWLVSATAEECVVSEKHLTQFFGKFGHLTRPNPTRPAGQPDPCPALDYSAEAKSILLSLPLLYLSAGTVLTCIYLFVTTITFID